MTYTLLNACFLIPAALLAWSARKRIPTGPWLLTAAVLIALTIIFDNIMIGVGLFYLSLIHISEPTRPVCSSRMPSSA